MVGQKLSLKEEGVEERAQDVIVTSGKEEEEEAGAPQGQVGGGGGLRKAGERVP